MPDTSDITLARLDAIEAYCEAHAAGEMFNYNYLQEARTDLPLVVAKCRRLMRLLKRAELCLDAIDDTDEKMSRHILADIRKEIES